MVSTITLSIITPCYNHGKYLDEMITSVETTVKNTAYELVIVDDGSTDSFTVEKINELVTKGYNVIRQSNQGLAAARNTAIKNCKGKYILPLDADNKLNAGFADAACDFLEKHDDYHVVYSDNIHFNDTRSWYQKVGLFDILKLINNNFIDACTVYRRLNWENWGGYDGNMPVMGHEDWELWMNYFFNGANFHYMPIPGFFYRVTNDSMNAVISGPGKEKTNRYINEKYKQQIAERYRDLYEKYARFDYLINEYAASNKLKAAIKILLGRFK